MASSSKRLSALKIWTLSRAPYRLLIALQSMPYAPAHTHLQTRRQVWNVLVYLCYPLSRPAIIPSQLDDFDSPMGHGPPTAGLASSRPYHRDVLKIPRVLPALSSLRPFTHVPSSGKACVHPGLSVLQDSAPRSPPCSCDLLCLPCHSGHWVICVAPLQFEK